MNQVVIVRIGGNFVSRGLFINAELIACAGGINLKLNIDMENLIEMTQSICIALNVSLVEVNFSEKFEFYSWQHIRDILLRRRVIRYRNTH